MELILGRQICQIIVDQLHTAKSGTLKVKFTLIDSAGVHSNSGIISLAVKPDFAMVD